MSEALREAILVAFPKAGTTALASLIEQDARFHVLRGEGGAYENPFPDRPASTDKVLFHKYSSYIYARERLQRLAGRPDHRRSLYIVNIRHPGKALLSWRSFHSEIARSGRAKWHFAYEHRDFYADPDLRSYYDRFAREGLRYADRLTEAVEVLGSDRLIIVEQERLARDPNAVMADIRSRVGLRAEEVETLSPLKKAPYGDRSREAAPAEIERELAAEWEKLWTVIESCKLKVAGLS